MTHRFFHIETALPYNFSVRCLYKVTVHMLCPVANRRARAQAQNQAFRLCDKWSKDFVIYFWPWSPRYCCNSWYISSYVSLEIRHPNDRSTRWPFLAAKKHASLLQIYAPRPVFLPVVSKTILPSGSRKMRTNSCFGFNV